MGEIALIIADGVPEGTDGAALFVAPAGFGAFLDTLPCLPDFTLNGSGDERVFFRGDAVSVVGGGDLFAGGLLCHRSLPNTVGTRCGR